MLRILPQFKSGSIERLSLALRRKCGLNRLDSRMMHVVEEQAINAPERIVRYNVRQADGSIKKVTMYENYLTEKILRKDGDSYREVTFNLIGY